MCGLARRAFTSRVRGMLDMVRTSRGRFAGALVCLLVFAAVARAEVRLAPLFTDGAVLQAERPLAVWGRAEPGESVQVNFAGQTRYAATGADGRWLAMLDAVPVSATGQDLVATAKSGSVTVRDVLVGEVWLCSGQSNMEWPVADAADAAREIAAARYPLIRHVAITHRTSSQPEVDAGTSGWKAALPEHTGAFSAVAYYFARDIHERLGVPIGLIRSTWGGTPIEAWMSPITLASDPAFAVVGERWRQAEEAFPTASTEFASKLATWKTADTAAQTKGEKSYQQWLQQNPRPRAPLGGPDHPWAPSGLYNAMINPLIPYAVRGILWYQGESNTGRPDEYAKLFPALITGWRQHLAQGELPFYWVNLAGFRPQDPSETSWARLREAQTATLALPNTGQALAIDIGDARDIHPRNKQEVGRRLALLAKRRVYDLVVDDTGPTLASVAREGAALRVRFSEVAGALVSRLKPPQSLELAGADGVYHPAMGRIERDTLVVTAAPVKEPVAVRYAWRNFPEANLYGGSGLPVVPFQGQVNVAAPTAP